MFRLLTLLCGWRDVQSRIHDMRLKLTIQDSDIWEMADRLTRGETFERVYNDIQSPSAILKSHFYSLQMFLDQNENRETFRLGELIEDVQHCLRRFCRSDQLNTQVVADMQSNLQKLEENLLINFTKSKQYWNELKVQWQKTADKAQKQMEIQQKRRSTAKSKDKPCGNCNEIGSLNRFSTIPDSFRQFFPEAYRWYQQYDFLYLCDKCMIKANNARSKASDMIAEQYGIEIYYPPSKNEKRLKEMLQSLEEDDQEDDDQEDDHKVKKFSLPTFTRDTYTKVLLLFTACVFTCIRLLSYSC